MSARIDLDHQTHLALLRTETDRTGAVVLREAPAPEDLGWIDGRAHEIVLPLGASQDHRPPRLSRPAATLRRSATAEHLPGAGNWLYAKIYTRPDWISDLLTEHLPQLMRDWPEEPGWWYLPYRDPRPHLRVRIRLSDAVSYGHAAERMGTWAADMRRQRLISDLDFATYRPELGRFGTGAMMEAAEAVFCNDSVAALTQIRSHDSADAPSASVLCAASFIDLCIMFTGSVDEAMSWLLSHVDRQGPPLDRALVRELSCLLDADSRCGRLAGSSNGLEVLQAWRARGRAVTAYRIELFGTGLDAYAVLASLLHLHHVRLFGIDPEFERTCLRLARAAALTWITRTRRSQRA